MKKVTTIAAALVLVVLPAGASAKQSTERSKAAQDCRAERSAAGAENFRTLYERFGQCVTQTVRENRAERKQARREAVADCSADDLEGRELKQCVRSERRQNIAEAKAEDQAELNAARDCRAERDDIGDEAFAEQYGTNHNNRNAFGKCVSGRVSQQETEETESDDVEEETKPEDGEETESDDVDEEAQPDDGDEETQPEDGEETPDDGDTVEDDA